MPVYTYRCQNCGVQFEKTQKFNDLPLARCPECRRGKVTRLLQTPNIVFKGSGWYATDQRLAEGGSPSNEPPTAKPDGQPTKTEKKSTQSHD